MKAFGIILAGMLALPMALFAQEKVTFTASDGFEVTADCYESMPGRPMVVLCHQAGWSRGEYQETAQWLDALGFNCLAVDQRSGDEVNGVKNETAARAKAKGLPQGYLDAEPDIIAAVAWASQHAGGPVILVGSSYSASLALKVAAENEQVRAVAAFSPGEYFGAKLNLGKAIDGLDKPTFITSSKSESSKAKPLADRVSPGKITHFVPKGDGHHGSRALWTSKEGHEEYRAAFEAWISGLK